MLHPDDYETWLTGEPDDTADLMRPFPADRMQIVRSGQNEWADHVGGL